MTELAILVPVLGRAYRVRPLLDSILRSTSPCEVLFICSPDDEPEIAAVEKTIRRFGGRFVRLTTLDGNYAEKINHGVRLTTAPLLFFGADDLEFHSGWFEKAKARMIVDDASVVGVNDLCSERVREGSHATHFLVTRKYAREPLADGNPGPLCEEYDHSCIDDEFWGTAVHRGALTVATDAIVEHLHPDAGKAEWDPTYEKGRHLIRQDRRRLFKRRHLWTST